MKFKMVLLRMFAGYAISGMKKNLNSCLKMIRKWNSFIKIIMNKNQFLSIFNLRNINLVILDQIYKNKKQNKYMSFPIGIFIFFSQ